jgi:hypothetical protein
MWKHISPTRQAYVPSMATHSIYLAKPTQTDIFPLTWKKKLTLLRKNITRHWQTHCPYATNMFSYSDS